MAAAVVVVPLAWTSAIATHGIWGLAGPRTDNNLLMGGSYAVGANVAFTLGALGAATGGHLPGAYFGGVEMAGTAPALAVGVYELTSPGRPYKPFFAGITAWSGALFAHGLVSLAVGIKERDADEEEKKKRAMSSARAPWMSRLQLAPTVLAGGRPRRRGGSRLGVFSGRGDRDRAGAVAPVPCTRIARHIAAQCTTGRGPVTLGACAVPSPSPPGSSPSPSLPVAAAAPILPAPPARAASIPRSPRSPRATSSTRTSSPPARSASPSTSPSIPATSRSSKRSSPRPATRDFQVFLSGMPPYAVVQAFGEYGDMGNLPASSLVGVAARLIVLSAAGGPSADLGDALASAIRAAQAWHVFGAIGGPGVVARGIHRVTPWSPGDPPFPGPVDVVTPLFDGMGNPQPVSKASVWRAPVAPGFDGWIWYDDTAKSQVVGYVLGAAWLWDALHDQPGVPANVTTDLAADLTAVAKRLMQVAPEYGVDLCIRDADGRLVDAHDLNPSRSTLTFVLPASGTLRNGTNAALALGIVRAAYHVSGDPDVGKYYYDELVAQRDYPTLAATQGYVYFGVATNYSNVDVEAIALALLGRFETDPYVRGQLATALADQLWSAGDDRDASHVQQAWYDAVYGAYGAAPPAAIQPRMQGNLSGVPAGAGVQPRSRSIATRRRSWPARGLGIDGQTVKSSLEPGAGHDGTPVAGRRPADVDPTRHGLRLAQRPARRERDGEQLDQPGRRLSLPPTGWGA